MYTVLIVEDAEDLAALLVRELARAGFKTHLASNGLRALELHASLSPDLVILDWMLPGLAGIDVLRQIRQTATTPVIMLTARTEEMDRVTGLEMGADDYVTKPFSVHELLARVTALLRRVEMIRRTMESDRSVERVTIARGRLRLDPAAHAASLHGMVLELSPTEFDLLHLLLRNPGRAFGRAYLLDAVWGAEYVGGDRSVDNAVLRLRKKLGAMAEDIETVWGVGYRMRHE